MAFVAATAAQAQETQADTPPANGPVTTPDTPRQAAQSGDVVVTGTRTGSKVADQPITAVTGDSIVNQGFTQIGQALTLQPQFGVPANSTVGSQGSYGAGQSFSNLYNLGAQRTLTLVNGSRFVSAATSSVFGASVGTPVDLGQIAPALVDRIDVVSVGGAPIYGSDAIAGTVNIILKKNFEGIDLTGSNGISEKGDGADSNVSLLLGKNFADGRGNITFNAYYDHQDGMTSAARFVTSADAPFLGRTTSSTGPSRIAYFGGDRFSVVSNTGIPLALDNIPFNGTSPGGAADPIFGVPYQAITNGAGAAMVFNRAGQLVPFQHGTVVGSLTDEAGGDGFRVGDYGNLLTNSQRIQGVLLGHYDFSDHIRFHAEAWASRNIATNTASQPLYNTALFSLPGGAGTPSGNYVVSSTNPYLSAADQATIQTSLAAAGQPTNQFYLARANTDLYDGAFTTRSSLARGVAGLDGDFAIGTHNFTWEGTVTYGQVNTTSSQPGLVWQNIQNAVNAVVGANGQITCAPGYTNAPIATLSSSCAPLNIFGTGNVSQAALNYINAPAISRQVNKQFDAIVDIKGTLAHLPAGDLNAVIGGEIRRESQAFDPGAFFAGTYSQYAAVAPVQGSYYTHEAFTEVTVPVLSPDMHIPLLRELTLHGAARYTDNSLNGGFWSYTGGGNWSPFKGLTLRGNYTRSFRAPSITEAFAPIATSFEYGNDPCDPQFVNGGSSPATRAKNCAAAGVPTDPQKFTSLITNATVTGLAGGNPNLANEVANSWTVGGQYEAPFLPGFVINADYIHIDIKNEIVQPGIQSIMQACYDSPSYPNSPFCSSFTRDPTSHQITAFTDTFLNIASQNYRAAQVSARYTLKLDRLGLPEGAGQLNLSSNYLHEFKNQSVVGTGSTQYALGAIGEPANAVTSMIDWQTPRFDWSWTVVYNGPTKVNPNNPASNYQYYGVSPYWMVNTSMGVIVNDHFRLRAIVNNPFNLGVTYAGPVPEFSTNKAWDAVFGRSYRISAEVKF
ncbi:TonB-dependent receptor domain-containing protein [Sphingomonas sp. Leaf21]|uniref:TonB-dependent receptor domain-containing protein n=1 Tax=Sphingomonas sp. Leaf21 TaxID=2876550 RepID=UPI001E47ACD9|nr:TonB-dependent receptor [Sphingomonas sp. Leaf21]